MRISIEKKAPNFQVELLAEKQFPREDYNNKNLLFKLDCAPLLLRQASPPGMHSHKGGIMGYPADSIPDKKGIIRSAHIAAKTRFG